MNTIALKGKASAEFPNKVSVREKLAAYFKTISTEYVPKMVCGILALTGNKNAFRTFQMLRELSR